MQSDIMQWLCLKTSFIPIGKYNRSKASCLTAYKGNEIIGYLKPSVQTSAPHPVLKSFAESDTDKIAAHWQE